MNGRGEMPPAGTGGRIFKTSDTLIKRSAGRARALVLVKVRHPLAGVSSSRFCRGYSEERRPRAPSARLGPKQAGPGRGDLYTRKQEDKMRRIGKD
ncbi:hypothetical protein Mapa_016997 [Marchantia paleacea]|nr:hypothetical protein Mapa_016997 [Marchantia paleacea]